MKPQFCLTKSIATLIAGTMVLTATVHALPKGESVRSGNASFQRDGSKLNIRAGDRAIIDYRSFNISRGEKVQFIQPGRNSTVLNRVTERNPSKILGTMEANGRIVLMNPYGIFFGNGAVVNVGSLIAAAGNMSDADFLAGNGNVSLSGTVTNRGNITAVDGVSLYGTKVQNSGTITSQAGAIEMLAGSQVYVSEGGGNIFAGGALNAPKPRVVSRGPAVSNTGKITAPKVTLASGDVYGLAVAHSGTIQSVDVTLQAPRAQVVVSGRVDASNRVPGATGGKVKFLGQKVTLRNAVVDVTGDAGGGEVLVGGDYQGGNGVQTARQTSVDAGSVIVADAVTNGDGGKVIVWADGNTNFSGAISARGGSVGGDGGFIETSGKNALFYTGTVDASAAAGAPGTWLLDPTNITINNTATPAGEGSFGGGNPTTFTPVGVNNTTIAASAITTPLNAGTSVIIQTASAGVGAGNITLTVPLNKTAGGAAALTFNAEGEIIFNAATGITSTSGALDVTLNAGDGITLNSGITSNGGNVVLDAGDAVTINAPILGGSGNVTIDAGGNPVTFGAGVTTLTAATLSVFGSNIVTLNNIGTLTATNATLAPVTGANIGLTGGAGTFSLDATEIAKLKSGVTGLVTIGVAGSDGVIDLGANVDLAGINLTLNGGQIDEGTNRLIANNLVLDLNSTDGANNVQVEVASIAADTTGGTSAADKQLTITDRGATALALGAVSTGGGNFQISTPNSLTLTGNVGVGAGTVTFAVNTAGADASSFTMNAGTSITSAATGGTSISITVNGPGGTGGASIEGLSATGSGADILVSTNGGGATGGAITISAPISTANVTADGSTSGSITLTAAGGVAVNSTVTTGSSSVADGGGAQAAASGGITINGALNGTGSLNIGDAALVGGGAGADTAVVGNITVNGAKISATSGAAATDRFNVAFGAPSGGGTLTVGRLLSTTTGGAGAAGGVFVTSASNLVLGATATSGGTIDVNTTGTANLTTSGGAISAAGGAGVAGGSLTLSAGGDLTIGTSGVSSNAGTVIAGAGLSAGAINLTAGGNITTGNGAVSAVGGAAVAGTGGSGGLVSASAGGNITIGDGGIVTTGGLGVAAAGGTAGAMTIVAGAGSTITLNGNLTAAAGAGAPVGTKGDITLGNLAFNAAGQIVTENNLTISGRTIQTFGALSPAGNATIATLNITGDLVFANGATYFANVGKQGGNIVRDQILISGSVSIPVGTITITGSRVGANNPDNNTLFSIITAGSIGTPLAFPITATISPNAVQYAVTSDATHILLARNSGPLTWVGADNALWSADSSWSTGDAPSTNDIVRFVNFSGGPNSRFDLPADVTLKQLVFVSGAFNIASVAGNTSNIIFGPGSNGLLQQSGTFTLDVPILLGANTVFELQSGQLTLGSKATIRSTGGNFSLNINRGALVNPGGAIVLAGNVGGDNRDGTGVSLAHAGSTFNLTTGGTDNRLQSLIVDLPSVTLGNAANATGTVTFNTIGSQTFGYTTGTIASGVQFVGDSLVLRDFTTPVNPGSAFAPNLLFTAYDLSLFVGANGSTVSIPGQFTAPAGLIRTLVIGGKNADVGLVQFNVAGPLSTIGAQVYYAAVNLTSDASITTGLAGVNTIGLDPGAGLALLAGTNSDSALTPRNLSINSPGLTWIAGDVGAGADGTTVAGLDADDRPLGSINFTNVAGAIHLGGNSGADFSLVTAQNGGVLSTGNQSFSGAVSLDANARLVVVNGGGGQGNISFGSTIDSVGGAFSLTASTAGDESFAGAIGKTGALSALTTDAVGTVGGTTTFNMAATGAGNRAGVNLTGALTINDFVTFNISGSTSAANPSVLTGLGGGSGSQTYNGGIFLSQNTVLADENSRDITFNSFMNGGFSLAVNTRGNEVFNGTVGKFIPLASLTTDDAAAPASDRTGGSTQFNMNAVGFFARGGVNVVNQVLINDAVIFNVSGSTSGSNPSVVTGVGVGFGGQIYNGPVTLAQNTVLADANAQNVTFNSTIDGAFALAVNSLGNQIFNGAIGKSAALTSLTLDDLAAPASDSVGGATQFNMNATGAGNRAGVNLTGALVVNDTTVFNIAGSSSATNPGVLTGIGGGLGTQSYFGPVTLNQNTVLADESAKFIRFSSSVDGGFNLSVNTGGNELFLGPVGKIAALASLTTDNPAAPVTDRNGGSAIFAMNAVGLGNRAGVNLTGALTINDDATFAVPGSTSAFNPSILTGLAGGTGGQTYNGSVNLSGNTVLADENGNQIVLSSAVNGAFTLFVNTRGDEVFNGAIGKTTALANLVTDDLSAPVSDRVGGAAQFNMDALGAGNVAGINTTGAVVINDLVVFNVTNSTNANPSVLSGIGGGSGSQSYLGAATLAEDTVLADTNGNDITFSLAVNSDAAATPRNLTVNTAGNEVFNVRLGGTFALGGLLTDANVAVGAGQGKTIFNFAGTVGNPTVRTVNDGTHTGAQIYNDAVELRADAVLSSTSQGAGTVGGNIIFQKTVDSDSVLTPWTLVVNTTGDEVFNARLGGTFKLGGLFTDTNAAPGAGLGKTIFAFAGTQAAPSVSTVNDGTHTGAQIYNGAVELQNDAVLAGFSQFPAFVGPNITFLNTVDSNTATTPWSLTVNTTGDEVFAARVGGVFKLGGLFTDANVLPGAGLGKTIFNFAGTAASPTVSTVADGTHSGAQVYNDAFELQDNAVLASFSQGAATSGGNISFLRTVDSNSAATPWTLEVNTTGDGVFNARVGGIFKLGGLRTDTDVLAGAGLGKTVFNFPGSFVAPTVSTVNDGGAQTGEQIYNDAVELRNEAVLSSFFQGGATTGGDITFQRTVDSDSLFTPRGLTVNTSGNEVFAARVGGVFGLGSLVTDGDVPAGTGLGNTIFMFAGTLAAPTVTTVNDGVHSGAQIYNDAVELQSDAVLRSTFQLPAVSGGNITFQRTIDSDGGATPRTLTVNTSGDEVFNGRIGSTFALGGLLTDADVAVGAGQGRTIFNFAGAVGNPTVRTVNDGTHTGAQIYNDAVELRADAVLSSTSQGAGTVGGNIIFQKTVDSDSVLTPWTLVVNTTGDEVFNARLGGTFKLGGLFTDTNAAPGAGLGKTIFAFAGTQAAPSVSTVNDGTHTGAQIYNGAVELQNDAVLAGFSQFPAFVGPNITFLNTVDSNTATTPWSLTVNTTGDEVFAARVGGVFKLGGLFTDANVLPGAGFGKTIFNFAGTAASPTVSTVADGTHSGAQVYNDAFELQDNAVLASFSQGAATSGGNISFLRTVDSNSAATPWTLEVNTTGDGVFNARVGGIFKLGGLRTDTDVLAGAGLGKTVFNFPGSFVAPTVSTVNHGGAQTGEQIYNDAVELRNDAVLTSYFQGGATTGGNITFQRTVDSDALLTPRSLTVNTSGNEVFAARVGGTFGLGSLVTDGDVPAGTGLGKTIFMFAGTVASPTVTTVNNLIHSGAQIYNDAVELQSDAVLTGIFQFPATSGGNITFQRTVDGDADLTPHSLTANTTGSQIFNGQVGGIFKLGGLFTDSDALVGAGLGETIFTFPGTTASPTVSTVSGNGQSGSQIYNDAVELRADTVLASSFQGTSTVGGSIIFQSTVDSDNLATPRKLEANTGGLTAFQADVGVIQPLFALTTDNAAATDFARGNLIGERTEIGRGGFAGDVRVVTRDGQSYGDPLVIPLSSQFRAELESTSNAIITFEKSIDGPGGILIKTAGDTTFKGRLGSVITLGSIATSGGGRTIVATNTLKSVNEQTYDDDVILSRTATFSSTSKGTISFNRTVTGKPGADLNIQTAGDAFLRGSVSVARLDAKVTGTTTLGDLGTPSAVTTTGFQRFTGNVNVLGLPASVKGDLYSSKSTEFSVGGLLSVDSGGQFVIKSKPVTLTGGALNDGILKVIGTGNFSAGAPVTGGGVLDVQVGTNNAMFAKHVTQKAITVGANVITLGDAQATGGGLTLAAETLLKLTGKAYRASGDILFNPEGSTLFPGFFAPPGIGDATILKADNGNLTVDAGGEFIMGPGEKFLVDRGALTIKADKATIGDLAAFTTLKIDAGSIVLLGREKQDIENNGREDLGLGFVAQIIDFGGAKLSFAPGTPQVATFATKTSAPLGVIRSISNAGITFVRMDDLGNQFGQDGEGVLAGSFLPTSLLQPIANGVLTSEATETQTIVLDNRPMPITFEQNTTITAAVKEALDRMRIRPRDATAEENESLSLLRGLFRQPIEGQALLEDDDYKVVVNRLVNAEVEVVLDAYLTLTSSFYEKWDTKNGPRPSPSDFLELAVNGQIKGAPTLEQVYDKPVILSQRLDELVQAYRQDDPNRDLGEFLKWVQDQRADKVLGQQAAYVADNLDNLARLVDRLGRIGLTRKELDLSKQFVLESIAGNYPELVEKLAGPSAPVAVPIAAPIPKIVSNPNVNAPAGASTPDSAAPGATPLPDQPSVQPPPGGNDVPPPPPSDVPPPPPGSDAAPANPAPAAPPSAPGAAPLPPTNPDAVPLPPDAVPEPPAPAN